MILLLPLPKSWGSRPWRGTWFVQSRGLEPKTPCISKPFVNRTEQNRTKHKSVDGMEQELLHAKHMLPGSCWVHLLPESQDSRSGREELPRKTGSGGVQSLTPIHEGTRVCWDVCGSVLF